MREQGVCPGKASFFINYHFNSWSETRSLLGMVIVGQLLRGRSSATERRETEQTPGNTHGPRETTVDSGMAVYTPFHSSLWSKDGDPRNLQMGCRGQQRRMCLGTTGRSV